jgi:succinate dehydrogenase hydrophobic anchor subunit
MMEVAMSGRVVAIVLLVLGIVLLIFGINASDAPVDRISEAFTGKFTDSTMLYLILGAAGIAIGVGMLVLGRRA